MMKLRTALGLPENSTIISDLPPVSAAACAADPATQLYDNDTYCCQKPDPGMSNYTCRRVRKTIPGEAVNITASVPSQGYRSYPGNYPPIPGSQPGMFQSSMFPTSLNTQSILPLVAIGGAILLVSLLAGKK